ncbi:MAG: T9SS type A sorting domain-containing protein [Bacteroidetes bacterium]|nr:T9SS type A sorting domain-containing protein [Bacteroidota bacterium]
MKRLLHAKLYLTTLLLLFLAFSQDTKAQTNYTWNGSTSTDWNTAANWTPNGIPGAADNITIVTGANTCLLNANAGISNFKLTSGTFDLGGYTLTINGATATFSTGTVQNGTMNIPSATTTTFGNGPITMNCTVSVTSATVTMRNTTFQKPLTVTKTGSSNDASSGGNTFNDNTVMNSTGSGYFLLGNGTPDVFNGPVTFNNTSSNHMYIAYNADNTVFNGVATFNNAPSTNSAIYVSQNSAGTLFNNDIIVSSTSGAGIIFNGNATTGSTLAAGKTITVGSGGYTSGYLLLRQFTQTGATAQNITLSGTSNLTFGPGSSFGGDLTVSSPTMYLNGGIFNGVTSFTKTGSTGDWSNGGNTFNGVSSFINTGSSYFLLGSSNPDIWNNDVTFSDLGSERILPCWSSTGNQFNGNIYVNTDGSATGIQFCGGNSTATATLAANKTIMAGSTGLNVGYLYLRQFTQLGSTPINLTATGSSVLYLGPNSNFGGAFTANAPDIWAQGATYNSTAEFTKTGGSSNHNNQYQNIFNSTLTINQQSNTGYFMVGYNSNDLFNDDVIITATGKGGIYLGWQGGTGTPTMAAGKTIQVGSAGFSAGFLSLNTFTQLGVTPINLNFTGANTQLILARGSVIGGNLTATTPDIYFNGCTFNGLVNVTKTGASTNYSSGNNIFQTGVAINNTGAGTIILGNGNPDIWNGNVEFNSAGSASYIGVGWNSAGNQFNGDISVTSSNGANGVYFCQNTASTATLAAGKTIGVGSAGFSSGTLYLRQFTQLGNAPVNLQLTGSTTLAQTGPSTTFGGDVVINSPRILMNTTTFSGVTTLTKTGITGEWSSGGNTFGSTLTVNHLGGGYFGFANSAPDIYNGDVYVNNNGTERVIFGNNVPGNQFNGNIILTQIGSSVGTAFGWNSGTDVTLAAGKTISIGSAGFTTGYLQIMRFTQLGNVPMSLPLTGNSSLTFGPTSTIGGNLVSTSGSLYFNGCTFNGTVNSTKTGASSDGSSGNNIFNGSTTITNAGSGYLLFGSGNRDQFMSDATFNNTGSANMHIAYNSSNNVFGGVTTFNNTPTGNTGIYVSQYSAGSVFSDNIIVTSTAGQGVQFCNGNSTATASLASGKTISIGAGGFSSGTLLLRQFTQLGATPQNLTLTGTGSLYFGPTSAFGGSITSSSPTLYFNSSNFDGSVTAAKTGPTNDGSPGNNTFNGPFTITNTGSGYFLMGNGSPDTWQSTATFNNLSAGQHMYLAYNSTGNVFNGDVVFNNQPGATGLWILPNQYGLNTQFNGNISVVNVNGAGVSFGNGTGTAVLASGKSISVGSAGFTTGGLIFRNFTQSGGAAQNITTTGTSYIQYGNNAVFNGPLTSSSPGLFFTSSTFNGTVNCTKTGTTNDQSSGNNVFNASSTFTNNGTGYLMMTASASDAYNNDVSFVQNNTGTIYPNYNNNSNYAGSISVTSPSGSAITFGSGTGTATLTGSSAQFLNATGSTPTPVFTRLVVANTGGDVTLNTTSINVSRTLTMTSGLLNTTATRILTMLNGSTTTVGDALSTTYVNGPMRYQKSSSGTTTLNFPVGNAPDSRPIVLTVNHSNGTLYTYTAQVYNWSAADLGYSLPPTVDKVSKVHYYTITRTDASNVVQPTAGLSGSQTVTLYFGYNDWVSDGGNLTVVKNTYNAQTSWIDIGGVGAPPYSSGSFLTGSITSTSAPSVFNSFSTFALGNKNGGLNVLPVGLLYFRARADKDKTNLSWATTSESNNSHFTVERSRDGLSFESLEKIASAAPNGNSDKQLNYQTNDANPYNGINYYRLKQTDLDGHDKYSQVETVTFDKAGAVSVYPNPTRGQVFVSGIRSSQNTVRVEWYNTGGKLLSQQSATISGGLVTLNPSFSSGLYLLKLITAEGNITFQQVIIMK